MVDIVFFSHCYAVTVNRSASVAEAVWAAAWLICSRRREWSGTEPRFSMFPMMQIDNILPFLRVLQSTLRDPNGSDTDQ